MALAYTVDSDRRLVIITGEYASATEWLTLAGDVLRDTRVKAGFAFLRDLRGATQVPNATMVVSVFQVIRRFWPTVTPSKAAIVTDSDDDSAARVAQALADSHNLPIQVFTSYEAALEWLER
jgi:hypothetical protein